MVTRFRIGDLVLFDNSGITYQFTITEIKIDYSGIWYSGEDETAQVGWHKEKHLELLS